MVGMVEGSEHHPNVPPAPYIPWMFSATECVRVAGARALTVNGHSKGTQFDFVMEDGGRTGRGGRLPDPSHVSGLSSASSSVQAPGKSRLPLRHAAALWQLCGTPGPKSWLNVKPSGFTWSSCTH